MHQAPSKNQIRAAFASHISKIVEFYISGQHTSATVDEIADGIMIENNAERETVYAAIDPYAGNTAKRDSSKPLIFERIGKGEYKFHGYNGDPLDLTEKLQTRDPLLKHAFDIFKKQARGRGLQKLSTSKQLDSFSKNLMSFPQILVLANERMEREEELSNLRIDL